MANDPLAMLRTHREDVHFLPPTMERPHVFLLGAGASRAALPQGDRDGRWVPLMKDLSTSVGLDELFAEHGLDPPGEDFERVFSDIAGIPKYARLVADLQDRMYVYFSAFALPEPPTLYDYLVLSLRPKDVIATFNWDPFLWDALNRNAPYADPPQVLFLHGNVAIGNCTKHTPASFGRRSYPCGTCGSPRERSDLLFPVAKKDYTRDPAIRASWGQLASYLKAACILTIFGYGAPVVDIEAMTLIRDAWGNTDSRVLDDVEIIDIRPEEEIKPAWDDLICRDHYQVYRSFKESYAASYPRRSCEAQFSQMMDCEAQQECEMPSVSTLNELYDWLAPRVEQERSLHVDI